MDIEVKRKRVGIVGISHESNTFISVPTTLENFQNAIFLNGAQVIERYRNSHHEVAGFVQTLEEAGIEVVPIFFANTNPWGTVSDAALDAMWAQIQQGLTDAGPLDGILAAPHGAGVNESRPDMDGWWLGEIRKLIGSDTPLVSTMDPHVNLSEAMVEACDVLISYRQNPHLDQRQRGIEAATLMVRILRGEIQPTMAAAFPPIAINIERQLTFTEPQLSVQRELDAVRSLPGVLTASLALGFPYADISDMGSAFVVVTDNQPDLAREKAESLALWLIENRELFRGEMISPEAAVARIAGSPKPVGLLDMGDNAGGGAPGDSTVLVRLCQEAGAFKTLFYIPDAESVALATQAGIGARVRLKVGGKMSMTPAAPLEIEATVVSFHDGKYTEPQPRHGGQTRGDMGPTVIVKTDDGLTVMLISRRGGPNASIQPFYACGLDPADFDVIVIKGVHAPVGAYADVCPTLIRVNTPGVTSADMNSLVYLNRRKPLFPFEDPFAKELPKT